MKNLQNQIYEACEVLFNKQNLYLQVKIVSPIILLPNISFFVQVSKKRQEHLQKAIARIDELKVALEES